MNLLSVHCASSTRIEVEKVMQSTDLARASKIITWNKWFLSFLGLWPCKVNQPLFVFSTLYMIIYITMAVGHLIKNFNQLERVVENLTDNILFMMIFGKMLICRRSCEIMDKFLRSIENDFSTETYDNAQEKTAYLHYNEIALVFVKFSMSIAILAATSYYFRKFLENWSAMSGNFSYELPYPVHPFFEIKDVTTYVCICIYLAIAIPIIICGYSAPDAYVLSMTLHVCGQFAALSCKVNNLLKDHKNYHRHISNIILRHRHLIRLAEILESKFHLICLQETLGTVFLLCFTVYHMIGTLHSENTNVIVFVLYSFCVTSTIFAYCYVGECLITESAGLREAFYNSDWYNNNSLSHTKLIGICMIRAERPAMLTAGKFFVLSLNTFTSIVKTSMAYLSLLRKFL